MKRILIMGLALLTTSAAQASGGWGFSPPARYMGAAEIKIHVIALPVLQIQQRCSNKAFPLRMSYGCAQIYNNPRRCVVFIPDKAFPNYAWPVGGVAVVTPKMVLDHEKAHCNGWPANHPK